MSLNLNVEIDGIDTEDNCLVFAGRKLTEIVGRADVPAYFYSSSLIRKRISLLRRVLPSGVELHYAIKANPMEGVVGLIAPLVDGLDVASGRELEVALNTQMSPAEISFAGPGKTDQELMSALEAGVTVNVESQGELVRLNSMAKARGTKARVAIRVNPDFELKGSGMRMSGGPKPFGIDSELVPQVLKQIDSDSTEFVGFHIFSGSQALSADAVIAAQSQTIELAIELSRAASVAPEFVNIGGGFGIPYFKGDKRLDLDRVASALGDQLERLRGQLPSTRLVLELGRYIVGEAGIYVCKVIDRKVSRGQVYLVTNGGLHHHLAASGNFGQVIRKDYPCAIGNRVNGDKRERAIIVGPLCTPLDVIASQLDVPIGTDVGDLVVVFQSGAYGRSASPLGFLSHPEPLEALL